MPVLAVVYLIFNEGYHGRVDLAEEAIRLGRVLVAVMPDESEAHGLLTLMMLHTHGGRPGSPARTARISCCSTIRTGSCGTTPDRRGTRRPRPGGRPRGRGPYVVQAAIASLPKPRADRLATVASLYRRLVELTGSAVCELNRAWHRPGRRPRRRACASSRPSTGTATSPATSTSIPPRRNCCDASAVRRGPRRVPPNPRSGHHHPERRFLTRRLEVP